MDLKKSIFNRSNVIYKVTEDIDLNGSVLNLLSNCTLDFQGGKFSNGTIILDATKILPNGCVISDYITAEIQGTYAKGQCLYDTTLNKPKWWNGTNWVDATGATV